MASRNLKCAHCGAEIEGRKRKFCQKSCRVDNNIERHKQALESARETRTCQRCRCAIPKTSHKFCPNCIRIAHNKKQRKTPLFHPCADCGEEICTEPLGRRKYCEDCAKDRKRRAARLRAGRIRLDITLNRLTNISTPKVRLCEVCKCDISKLYPNTKFCADCRAARMRSQNKAWKERNKPNA